MLDITVLGLLIGQGVGRWGNFVNQEAFGTNTGNIFGMTGGTIQKTIFVNSNYTDGSMLNIDYLDPFTLVFYMNRHGAFSVFLYYRHIQNIVSMTDRFCLCIWHGTVRKDLLLRVSAQIVLWLAI